MYFSAGGSEATEVAMKLAIQHFQAKGEGQRTKILGRRLSYHGTTIATTAVGGHDARKAGLGPLLAPSPSWKRPIPCAAPLGRIRRPSSPITWQTSIRSSLLKARRPLQD